MRPSSEYVSVPVINGWTALRPRACCIGARDFLRPGACCPGACWIGASSVEIRSCTRSGVCAERKSYVPASDGADFSMRARTACEHPATAAGTSNLRIADDGRHSAMDGLMATAR